MGSNIVRPLLADEARVLTDRIKAATEQLWALLLEAYERRAWEALGYSSWREWATQEFEVGQSHAYRLLDQARVISALTEAAGVSPIGEITEYEARELKAHLGEAVEDVRELVEEGMKPEAAVEAVVEKYTSPLMSSSSSEWYTPPSIIHRVIDVMGGIDLDPCADPEHRIPATHHFAKEDDGLTRAWRGRVYMNPPYGDEITSWVEKLVNEFEQGRTEEAIALVPARVDTSWWWKISLPVAFVRGRLRFSEHPTGAPFPSALLYFGQSWDTFAEIFNRDGFARCYVPADYV